MTIHALRCWRGGPEGGTTFCGCAAQGDLCPHPLPRRGRPWLRRDLSAWRTEAAGFGLDRAVRLEDVQAAADRGRRSASLLPVDAYFRDHPALTVGPGGEGVANGGSIPGGGDGTYRSTAWRAIFMLGLGAGAGGT